MLKYRWHLVIFNGLSFFLIAVYIVQRKSQIVQKDFKWKVSPSPQRQPVKLVFLCVTFQRYPFSHLREHVLSTAFAKFWKLLLINMHHLILLHSCLTVRHIWTIISVSRRHQWASQAFPIFCWYNHYYRDHLSLTSTHICMYVGLLFRCAVATKRWFLLPTLLVFLEIAKLPNLEVGTNLDFHLWLLKMPVFP